MTLDKESNQICKPCPFRRDSIRYTDINGKSHASWYNEHFWYPYSPPECMKEKNHICLGSLIHILNLVASSQLAANIRNIAIQYEKDLKLIFTSDGEFIRYHNGEDFGSKEWFTRTQRYMKEEEIKPQIQGELF